MILGGGRVLLFATIDESVPPTNGCIHTWHGQTIPTSAALAVVQYEHEDGFYLFHLDRDNRVIADTWHLTQQEAESQAEFEFAGISARWRQPPM